MEHSTPPPLPLRRPIWVWIITGYYLLSTAIHPLVIAFVTFQARSLDVQPPKVDPISSHLGFTIMTAGITLLFVLHRWAYPVLFSATIVILLETISWLITSRYLSQFGVSALFGVICAFIYNAAIVVYSRYLLKRGYLSGKT